MAERLLRDWVIMGTAGGAVGFLTGWLLKGPYTKWRMGSGFDANHEIHHAGIGSSIAMLGGLVTDWKYAPALAGFGFGLAVEDYAHHFGEMIPKAVTEVVGTGESMLERAGIRFNDSPSLEAQYDEREEDLLSIVPDSDGKKAWYSVSNWPPVLRTKQMTDLMRKIIYKDAHHPAVRKYMEQVIKSSATDGRDEDAILPALWLWIRQNFVYVHDEARAPDGSLGVDRFQHSYVTLPPSKLNPQGRGVGDCDCLAIVFCSMCQSVGIEDVCLCLVDQTGKGYSHVAPARIISAGKPKSIDDCIFYELTEDRPPGWRPPARKFGFVLL